MNCTKNSDISLLHYIALEIIKYIVQKCMYTVENCIYIEYKVVIYSTGVYVHKWYSHTPFRMRMSIP